MFRHCTREAHLFALHVPALHLCLLAVHLLLLLPQDALRLAASLLRLLDALLLPAPTHRQLRGDRDCKGRLRPWHTVQDVAKPSKATLACLAMARMGACRSGGRSVGASCQQSCYARQDSVNSMQAGPGHLAGWRCGRHRQQTNPLEG